MKKILSTLLVIGAIVGFVGPFAVAAQGNILPDPIKGLSPKIVNDQDRGKLVADTVTSAMTVMFIAVFIVAVFYTFMAAIKYIRSEGNEQKVEEAKNAVKAVLFGVAAMFIAIIGILLINAFFGSTGTNGLGAAINSVLDPFKSTKQ